LKISDIKTYITWQGIRNLCLVKIESDDGFYGWGESGLSGREMAVEGAIKHYSQFLVGKDSRRIGALWQEMYRSQYFEGGRVLVAAISAIDIALHDLNARRLGVPVYQLLGGKHRDFVPCFVTSQVSPGPELAEDVKRLISRGWKVIRTGIGHPDTGGDANLFEPRESIAMTAQWLTRLREDVGREPVLGIDYHHRLSVAEAASFCQMMPQATLDFLEEPIRDECPEAYIALRQMTNVPFAIGEEISSKWHFLPYIEKGLTNFARVDICNVGGFTEAMKVAGWCEAHYIDLMPHNPLGPVSTAANIHLAAAVPNYAWLEERSPEPGFGFSDEVFTAQPKLEGIQHRITDTAGLGIEINEEAISEETFKFWEAPHLHRRDRSYTNW
jgi:galactonate dehydratase